MSRGAVSTVGGVAGVIVADDLTGAADAAAPFAGCGARVLLDPTSSGDPVAGTGVLSLSTGSREASPQAARAAVLTAVRALGRAVAPGWRWFKKIDSTLKGHVDVEVATLLGWLSDGRPAVVCPAVPAWGRTVDRGQLIVGGRPRVPVDRALGTDVRHVAQVPLEVVRAGADAVVASIMHARSDRIVVDAGTDHDLEMLAEALHRFPGPVLPVGASGLAAALARTGPRPVQVGPPSAAPADRILVVVGSRQRISHDQVASLRRRPGVQVATLPTTDLASWPQRLHDAFADAPPVTVAVTGRGGASDDPDPTRVREGFASALSALAAAGGELPNGLVLVGGDVAAASLAAIGATAIDLLGEVEPGMPIGTLVGGALAGIRVVTKAGGFGHDGSLAAALDRFQTASENP